MILNRCVLYNCIKRYRDYTAFFTKSIAETFGYDPRSPEDITINNIEKEFDDLVNKTPTNDTFMTANVNNRYMVLSNQKLALQTRLSFVSSPEEKKLIRNQIKRINAKIAKLRTRSEP